MSETWYFITSIICCLFSFFKYILYILCLCMYMIYKIVVDTYNRKMETEISRSKISKNWETYLQNNKELSSKTKINRHVNEVQSFIKKMPPKTEKNSFRNRINGTKLPNMSTSKENKSSPILTQYIAMDCEFVGIGDHGTENMLARVSLVNTLGDCIYDTFVKPREPVTDYRTPVSGVRKEDLANGESYEIVQKKVAEILKGKILIGHGLKNDIEVLFLSHPKSKIRDTSKYFLFKMMNKGRSPSLKFLSKALLGVDIQSGEHSSIEDAKAAMQLYCLYSRQWEESLKRKYQRFRKEK